MNSETNSRPICVVTILDDAATQKIYTLQRLIGREQDLSAHITIATYPSIDPAAILPYVESFCKSQKSFSTDYMGLGLFHQSCMFAMPRLNKPLYHLYESFHQQFDDHCDSYTSLATGKWTPHTSLCQQTSEKILLLWENFEAFDCRIIGLKVKDYGDSFRELGTFYFE